MIIYTVFLNTINIYICMYASILQSMSYMVI